MNYDIKVVGTIKAGDGSWTFSSQQTLTNGVIELTYGSQRSFTGTLDLAPTHICSLQQLKTITYASSDPSVATIDSSGNVKIRNAGSTTILAEVKGDFCNTKTFSYVLQINKRPLHIKLKYFDYSSGTEQTAKSFTTYHNFGLNPIAPFQRVYEGLQAGDTSQDIEKHITYASSDVAIALVNSVSGVVTPQTGSLGKSVTITVNYTNPSGDYADASADYRLTIRGAAPRLIYSLRRWPSNKSGYAIKTQTTSGNVEKNIGFDNYGHLDESSIPRPVSGEVRVATMYDQSSFRPNSISANAASDATQDGSNVKLMPQLVDASGDVQKFDSTTDTNKRRIALNFLLVHTQLRTPIHRVITNSSFTIFAAIEQKSPYLNHDYVISGCDTSVAMDFGTRWRKGVSKGETMTISYYGNDLNLDLSRPKNQPFMGAVLMGMYKAGKGRTLKWDNEQQSDNIDTAYTKTPHLCIGGINS